MAKRYQQYCAMARALDVIGDRWTPLIVRNLILGPMRYGDLRRTLPGIATNLLASRLKHLDEHGVIAQDGDHYQLTDQGRALEPALFALADWGEVYAFGPPRQDDRFHPRWLMTSMRRKQRPGAARAVILIRTPDEPYVIQCGPEATVYQGTAGAPDLIVEGEDPRAIVMALRAALARPERAAVAEAMRQSFGEWLAPTPAP